MLVTAEPGNEDNKIRRNEFPRVVPYPRSSGSTTILPNLASSLTSIVLISGNNALHSCLSHLDYTRRRFGGRQPL